MGENNATEVAAAVAQLQMMRGILAAPGAWKKDETIVFKDVATCNLWNSAESADKDKWRTLQPGQDYCCCIVGARTVTKRLMNNVVVDVLPLVREVVSSSKLLGGGRSYGSVAQFNDAPETTLEDVLRVLDLTLAPLLKDLAAFQQEECH
jgi:hypothetical protein